MQTAHFKKTEWGVETNSAFFKRTEGVCLNSAFCKNKMGVQVDSAKGKFKQTPQRGSSCELRIFQKDSGEFKQTCACCKNRVGS